MTKRLLILFLVCILAVPIFVVPASATTQGVINAIEDLEAGLGDSQRDIVDLLTSIDEWIYELYSATIEISTTLYDSIYESYCVPMLAKFDILSQSVRQWCDNASWYFFFGQYTYDYPIFSVEPNGYIVKSYVTSNPTTGIYSDLGRLGAFIVDGITNILLPIHNKIQDLLRGNTDLSDQFNEDQQVVEDQLNDMSDAIATAPTISVDDIQSEVDKIAEFEPDTDYLDILSSVFLHELFLTMFSWCVIFGMLGYILYGKR